MGSTFLIIGIIAFLISAIWLFWAILHLWEWNKKEMIYSSTLSKETIDFPIMGGTGSIELRLLHEKQEVRCRICIELKSIDENTKKEILKNLYEKGFKREPYSSCLAEKTVTVGAIQSEIDSILDNWGDF